MLYYILLYFFKFPKNVIKIISNTTSFFSTEFEFEITWNVFDVFNLIVRITEKNTKLSYKAFYSQFDDLKK